jgi:hypothetical protein
VCATSGTRTRCIARVVDSGGNLFVHSNGDRIQGAF